MMKKNKISIACQGGGSQTAFTAGVLKAFFDNDIHKKKEIVSLSGTSGGAVCATLSWYSLLQAAKGDKSPIAQRLIAFWEDNSTQNAMERLYNDSVVNYVQLNNRGLMPEWNSSPDSTFFKAMLSSSTAMLPRKHFYDFQGLLEHHIDFKALEGLNGSSSPVLLIGAANVLDGVFKRFNSRKGEIKVEAILASAAVPSLFPAVKVDGKAYWDGLFSDNPPIDELINPKVVGVENIPNEIWTIQINPIKRDRIPHTAAEVIDRRNEMIGNVSMLHDLKKVKLFNYLLKNGAFTEEFRAKYQIKEPIVLRKVKMSKELQDTLDYSSKVNRDNQYIKRLIEDGEKKGEALLKKIE